MPSRKRTKGKQRKKKNQVRGAVERDVSSKSQHLNLLTDDQKSVNMPSNESENQNSRQSLQTENGKCLHVPPFPLEFPFGIHPGDHHVDSFIDTYAQGLSSGRGVLQLMEFTYATRPVVWKDSELRKKAIEIMLSIGTDYILKSNLEDAKGVALAIIILDKYDGSDGVGTAWVESYGYMFGAGDRETVHFFKKRIPCSCLDELYSQLKKSQDRVSECFHCKQPTNHKILKKCSRCKYAHYCSRECQVADWPSHKATCDNGCLYHEKVKKGERVRYCSYDDQLPFLLREDKKYLST